MPNELNPCKCGCNVLCKRFGSFGGVIYCVSCGQAVCRETLDECNAAWNAANPKEANTDE